MDVVMILPGWMMGPYDAAPTSAGQLVLDLLARKLPGIIDGGASLADARDVAAAMVSAAQRGVRAERYIVAGKLTTMKDIALGLQEVSGVKVPKMVIPDPMVLSLAWCLGTWAGLTGGVNSMPLTGIQTCQGGTRVRSNFSSFKRYAQRYSILVPNPRLFIGGK
jgi:dihydroflavonol-4-reductase